MENSAVIKNKLGVNPFNSSEQKGSTLSFATVPEISAKRKDDNSELLSALDGLAVMNMPLVTKSYVA